MVINFKNTKTERLCNDLHYAQQELPQPIVKSLKVLMSKLDEYHKFNAFFLNPLQKSYNTEKLKGRLSRYVSLRIKQGHGYRMILEVSDDTGSIDIIEIIEVNNHDYNKIQT